MALKRFPIASFSTTGGTVPETKTLLTAAALKETIVLSLLVSNNSTTQDANVQLTHTDGTSTIFTLSIVIPVSHSAFVLDSMWVFEAGDVLTVTSDNDNVSVIASGDES